MNSRPEQLLQEVQQLRRANHRLTMKSDVLAFLAVGGWVLCVLLLAITPA